MGQINVFLITQEQIENIRATAAGFLAKLFFLPLSILLSIPERVLLLSHAAKAKTTAPRIRTWSPTVLLAGR